MFLRIAYQSINAFTDVVFISGIFKGHIHVYAVHPRLSEQAELNLKSGRSEKN